MANSPQARKRARQADPRRPANAAKPTRVRPVRTRAARARHGGRRNGAGASRRDTDLKPRG